METKYVIIDSRNTQPSPVQFLDLKKRNSDGIELADSAKVCRHCAEQIVLLSHTLPPQIWLLLVAHLYFSLDARGTFQSFYVFMVIDVY